MRSVQPLTNIIGIRFTFSKEFSRKCDIIIEKLDALFVARDHHFKKQQSCYQCK